MKVCLAEEAGFCFGVRKAVETAENTVDESEKPVFTLGPLIHNPQEIERLKQRGLRVLEGIKDLSQIDEGTVIIRTHGVAPRTKEEIVARGLEVVDATCPFVRRAQRRAEELTDAGYRVVVVGDPDHPEVKGIIGHAGEGVEVIEDFKAARRFRSQEKVGLVPQTTQRRHRLEEIASLLEEKVENLRIEDTICHATQRRQEAARDTARKVDAMVIIGGYNSSNTAKLASICREMGVPAYHIEKAEELRREWFYEAEKVGITAGASTPDWIIKEVMTEMENANEERDDKERQEGQQEPLGKEEGEEAAEEIESAPEREGSDDSMKEEKESLEEKEEMLEEEEEAKESGEEEEEKGQDVEKEEEVEETEQEKEEEEEEKPAQTQEEETAAEEIAPDKPEVDALKRGDLLQGKVVQVNEKNLVVDIGYRSKGVIPASELTLEEGQKPADVWEPGDEVNVFVLSVDGTDRGVLLSERRAETELSWQELRESFETEEIIEGEVIEEVKGGLVVDVGVRAFMPASHVDRRYVPELSEFVGDTVRMRIIELDRSNERVIVSRKDVREEEYQRLRRETWENIEEDQVVEGVVKGITNFGAFIDLGGVDGLLHVSEMSWGRVNHPSDVVEEGEDIEVKVLDVNREEEKISLGLKQILPNPWDQVEEEYPVGSIVDGKVMRLAPFGAFVQLEPGVEGLVHISELADYHVEKPEEVVSEGETIKVKVLRVQPDERRISLSLKEARADLEEAGQQDEESVGEADVTLGEVFGDLLEETKEEIEDEEAEAKAQKDDEEDEEEDAEEE